jgi:catechol 2,3-dioxygenase-like lactoylglutathione lyase family enzyme
MSRFTKAAKHAAGFVGVMVLASGAARMLGQAPPPQAQTQAAPAGLVTGVGNFGHTVANLERSVAFYRDVLGLELARPPAAFAVNPAISRMTDTVGGQSRIAVLKVPGSTWGIELIDYKDVDRQPAHPRFQDPGAANLSLRVRDLGAVVTRLKAAGAHVLTVGGEPVSRGGSARVIFVQDPDGFVVELNQPDPLPAASEAAPGNVISGGIEVVVADAEKTVNFYRDVLGFVPQTSGNPAFNGDKNMTDTAGTPGAQFRQRRALVPGSSVPIAFMEFKGIDREPLTARVRDPGSAVLQLRVRDAAAAANALKAAGATIVSVGGEPADLGNNVHIAIARDANNLFLELIQAPPR